MPRSVEELIRAEHAAATDRVRALTAELAEITNDSAAAHADDEHDPEGSTLAFERALSSALLAQAERYAAELDEALLRCEREGPPDCWHCDGRISMERLIARPATGLCSGCAASGRSDADPLHRGMQRHRLGS